MFFWLGLGYWIATQDRPARQLVVTAGLGLILFFIHGLAFALWGLLLIAIELSIAGRAGDLRLTSLAQRTGRLALIAVGPVLLFLGTNTAGGEGGVTGSVSNLIAHAEKGNFWLRIIEELHNRVDGILRVVEIHLALRGHGNWRIIMVYLGHGPSDWCMAVRQADPATCYSVHGIGLDHTSQPVWRRPSERTYSTSAAHTVCGWIQRFAKRQAATSAVIAGGAHHPVSGP